MDYRESDLGETEEFAGDEAGFDTEAEQFTPAAPAEPAVKAGKYRVFSLLLFLLTAGGLFLGLIGNYAAWLKPSYYYGVAGAGLDNSLLGFSIAHVKELFLNFRGVFQGSAGSIVRHVFALTATVAIAVAVLTSLICLIITLFSAKKAKGATKVGGAVSLLAYIMLFFWAYLIESLHAPAFSASVIDVPVALIACALFVVLAIFSVVENGAQGLLGPGIFLFTVAIGFALFFPASFTETHFTLLHSFKQYPLYNVFSVLTVGVLFFNLIVSAVTLPNRSRGIFRCVFYCFQLLFVGLLALFGSSLGRVWSTAFFTNGTLLPSVVLLIASFGAFLLSFLAVLTESRARALEEEAARAAALAEEEEEEDEKPYLLPETLPEEADETPEEPEMEPVPEVEESEPEEEFPSEEIEAEETEEPSEEPEAEETEEDKEELSPFEKRMLAFTQHSEEEELTETPEEEPPFPPYVRPAPAPEFRPVNVYTDPSTQYTYDPFINELTPEEKNEFGDLFIACKSGRFGDLPIYKIGGDNTEFFDKVWIRYGLYDMSPKLREKLFNYLKKYRNRP